MAKLTFGGAKKSRFPYWVIPTVIFVFGMGMLVGRGIESNLTLAEVRSPDFTVSDLIERLWPKRRTLPPQLPVRAAVQQTETENRLKSENTRLMTEKDTLVEQVQAVKTDLRARDETIKKMRTEINKLAQSNQELIDVSKEHEKFREQLALEKAAARKQQGAKEKTATTVKTAPKPSRMTPKPSPTPQAKIVAEKTVVKPTVVRAEPQYYQGPSYQVLRRTPILRNPSDNAQVLSYLSAGRRVQVAGIVNGRFMRLQYSRSGNPPGYVLASDVTPLR